MVQPHELIEAHNANVRHNQIGGQTDGVDADVMADLGYETPERTIELIVNLGDTAATANELEFEDGSDAADSSSSSHVRSTQRRSSLSARGKLLADREPDTEHDLAYREPVILTADEIAAKGRGIQIMRNALAEERLRRKVGRNRTAR